LYLKDPVFMKLRAENLKRRALEIMKAFEEQQRSE